MSAKQRAWATIDVTSSLVNFHQDVIASSDVIFYMSLVKVLVSYSISRRYSFIFCILSECN